MAIGGQFSRDLHASAKVEWERVKSMLHTHQVNIHWCADNGATFQKPFSITALKAFTNGLKLTITNKFLTYLPHLQVSEWIDTTEREKRTVQEMQRTVQQVVQLCEQTRQKNFWDKLSGDTLRQDSIREVLRAAFWNQIGRLPDPSVSANVRARLMQKTNKWTSYQVMLDVWKGVFTYGILLIPNDLEPGEKRPLVVCQHGLEGDPMDVVTTDPKAENYHFYRGFASQLADKGYIVFAPANIYKGEDKFRVLQRKANPLGLSLFSIIVGQHQRIVQWLQQLPFVESNRIGFYGLSYGGCSAMRIPALIKGYSFSICSANFNEWVRKVASVNYVEGYVYNEDYEMSEWDLGHTFNYAEMAALIAPRPFMVERGYFDGVGKDEWVSYEFAKVQRYYTLLGLPDRVRIERFLGKHTIHGVGTFEFIDHFFKNNPQY